MSAFATLIGRWETTGIVLGEDGETEVARISGTDEYEPLGDAFLTHRVEVSIGEDRVQAIEMIGSAEEGGRRFTTRAFDASGTYEESAADFDGDRTWTFRATGAESVLKTAEDGNSMSAAWTRQTEAGSTPWMRIEFTRQS